MPKQGGRYVMRGGKRERVHHTKPAPTPTPPAAIAVTAGADPKPAPKAASKPQKAVEEKSDE